MNNDGVGKESLPNKHTNLLVRASYNLKLGSHCSWIVPKKVWLADSASEDALGPHTPQITSITFC